MIINVNNFNNFNLNKNLLKVIEQIGYKKPTEIQLKCIPLFLKGHDILGIAKTGSGKTASFVLPILNIINNKINILQALILSPTRELVIQITNIFKLFSKYIKNIKIVSLYGGQKYNIQFYNLKNKPQIIIATPGRLLDHLNRKTLNLNLIKILVLDEADEMFHMGFIKDVKKIIYNIKCIHQTALFSATMPFTIKNIVKKFMSNHKEIILSNNNFINIKQYFCYVNFKNKIDVLIKFLENELFKAIIIFVNTKNFSSKLSYLIEKQGYLCSCLNGDMNQFLREKIINNFRKNKINILVATDVASRGLDLDRVDLVINYDIPYDINSYIHRIGRTGRADNIGKTILLLEFKNRKFLFNIRKFMKCNINKIDIPNDKDLFKKRLLKIVDLIKIKSFDDSKQFIDFYKNFLFKISNLCNKKLLSISIILLRIVYEQNFPTISYKNLLENFKSYFK